MSNMSRDASAPVCLFQRQLLEHKRNSDALSTPPSADEIGQDVAALKQRQAALERNARPTFTHLESDEVAELTAIDDAAKRARDTLEATLRVRSPPARSNKTQEALSLCPPSPLLYKSLLMCS